MSIAPEPRMSPCLRCGYYFCECPTVEPFGLTALGMHGRDDDGVDHPPPALPDEDKYLAVIDRMIDLEQVLRRVLAVHEGACRFDHHGFCQEHGFEAPCAVAWARRLLDPAAGQEEA